MAAKFGFVKIGPKQVISFEDFLGRRNDDGLSIDITVLRGCGNYMSGN